MKRGSKNPLEEKEVSSRKGNRSDERINQITTSVSIYNFFHFPLPFFLPSFPPFLPFFRLLVRSFLPFHSFHVRQTRLGCISGVQLQSRNAPCLRHVISTKTRTPLKKKVETELKFFLLFFWEKFVKFESFEVQSTRFLT